MGVIVQAHKPQFLGDPNQLALGNIIRQLSSTCCGLRQHIAQLLGTVAGLLPHIVMRP